MSEKQTNQSEAAAFASRILSTPKPAPVCEVGGCEGRHWARGLCRKHYEAARRVRIRQDKGRSA